jgi:hypothetical protein
MLLRGHAPPAVPAAAARLPVGEGVIDAVTALKSTPSTQARGRTRVELVRPNRRPLAL